MTTEQLKNNVLDTSKETKGLQLPDKFEDTFKDKENRLTLVAAVNEKFKGLEENKKEIKDKAAGEIKEWKEFPKQNDPNYSAKIAVLYLYTSLEKGINPNVTEVENVYKELKEKQKEENTKLQQETELLGKIKEYAIAEVNTKYNNYNHLEYSDSKWNDIVNEKNKGEKNIGAAVKLEEVATAKDNTLKAMDSVLTKTEEEDLAIKSSIKVKEFEQQENEEKDITYVANENGERGHKEKIPADLSLTNNFIKYSSGLSAKSIINPINYEAEVFVVDKELNDFMNSYEEDKSMFYGAQADMFNYIVKNYQSLSKNPDINSEIKEHIVDYLETNNTNTDYPDIRVKNKEITGVTLNINPKTGLYYFDVPVENIKKGKSTEGMKSIHIYSQADEGYNVIINEGEVVNTQGETKNEVKEEVQENQGGKLKEKMRTIKNRIKDKVVEIKKNVKENREDVNNVINIPTDARIEKKRKPYE